MTTYYVGLDVHKASICVAVLNDAGKLVMESVVETSAATVLDFLKSLRGRVEVTFEEGTHAAWLYDVLHNRSKRQFWSYCGLAVVTKSSADHHMVGAGLRRK